LPVPLNPTKRIAFLDQHRPDGGEDPTIDPPLKGAMDTAVIGETVGQSVPLAAGPETKDDGVQSSSLVNPWPTSTRCGIVFRQDWHDPVPEGIRHFPDRVQLGDGATMTTHQASSPLRSHHNLQELSRFEIVT